MGIRKVEESDYPDVKMIYQSGIGLSNFETPRQKIIQWIKLMQTMRLCYIKILYSNRCAYEGVEISIYVHPDHKQNQIGSNLYKHLEEKARESGYWTIQAQLFIH